ncbi:MAG: hypothetical protein GXO35_05525, partial [Gammaproteobacteria bacterium]|nr:hypothetical protein [Gammaproteobacteria bacterium]
MKKMLKSVAAFFSFLFPDSLRRQARVVGWRNVATYFFFQRILRVNSHVPWPVHWSSKVTAPEKIIRKGYRPWPGYMIGQYIQAINGIHIGYGVRIGPGVKLISANHNLNDYDIHDPAPPIELGDNCWLGANVVVLPGIRLGTHVVVAAGAVVTKSFEEDNILLAGVPARIIKRLGEYEGVLGYANE